MHSVLTLLQNTKIRNKKEYYYILLLFALWGNVVLNFGIVAVSKVLHIVGLQVYLYNAIIVILSLLSIGYWGRRSSFLEKLLLAIFNLAYVFSILINPEYKSLISFYPQFLFACLCYLIIKPINVNKLDKPLFYISVANVLFSAFYHFVYIHRAGYSGETMVDSESGDMMSKAYAVLPSVLYVLWTTIRNLRLTKLNSWINIGISALACLLISSFGTRGAFVCMGFFLVSYVFLFVKHRNAIIIKVISLFIGILIYIKLDLLLNMMINLTSSLGMSSRIFTYVAAGTFIEGAESSDIRIWLIEVLSKELDKNPGMAWTGHGICGWEPFIHAYPHNLYYDIVFCYGYLLGYLFFAWLAILLLRSFISNSIDTLTKGFILIMVSTGIVILFMSGTYLTEYRFFMAISLCVYNLRYSKTI